MSLPVMNQPVSLESLSGLGEKWSFVGVDLAPSDALETGIAVIDRSKTLLRMDKVDLDKDIFTYLESIGPKSGLIIALDIPKSLSYTSKWRQQQIKMHPLRMLNTKEDEGATQRFAPRAGEFYRRATAEGFFVVNFFSHYAKMRYGLQVPFRSRSPQGCRAQQSAIKEVLRIRNMPSNLAPSSVLDAMIGAYTAWSIYQSYYLLHKPATKPGRSKNPKHGAKPKIPFQLPFQLYEDTHHHLYIDPLTLCPER